MDNRKFCKTVKPLFSDKSKSRKTITFIENKKIEVNNSKIADVLHNYFSNIIKSLKIPDFENIDNLLERTSQANITPVLKKSFKNQKENYRTVSKLLIFSKIFENFLKKQLLSYFENILPKFKCGFSAQHCWFKNGRKAVDNDEAFAALLTYLWKAFDCLSQDLLIAKFQAYGISLPSLKLLTDYLTKRKQRTKVGSSYRSRCSRIDQVKFVEDSL